MQIGDLSPTRSPQRLHQNPIVQAMSLVLMVGFMLAGWMAFSASGHETAPAPQKEAAIAPPVEAAKPQADATPQAALPRQVADAGSSIPLSLLAPPAAPAGPVAEAAPPPAPEQVQASVATPSVASAQEPPAAPAAPVQSDTTGAVSVQANAAPPAEPSEDLVDLNSASFETLNTMPGAGPVGRAIIKGRPYASAEDLVTKKVLRRSIYEKIKDRVTAR